MSDTPRTDAVWEKFETDLRGELEPDVEFSTLARQLKRELNAANVEIEEKRKDIVYLATEKAKLEERIKRLEEMYEGEPGERPDLLGSNVMGLLKRELNSAQQRIKRLEEAGDALENDNYTSDNLEAWRKAKEAKL